MARSRAAEEIREQRQRRRKRSDSGFESGGGRVWSAGRHGAQNDKSLPLLAETSQGVHLDSLQPQLLFFRRSAVGFSELDPFTSLSLHLLCPKIDRKGSVRRYFEVERALEAHSGDETGDRGSRPKCLQRVMQNWAFISCAPASFVAASLSLPSCARCFPRISVMALASAMDCGGSGVSAPVQGFGSGPRATRGSGCVLPVTSQHAAYQADGPRRTT